MRCLIGASAAGSCQRASTGSPERAGSVGSVAGLGIGLTRRTRHADIGEERVPTARWLFELGPTTRGKTRNYRRLLNAPYEVYLYGDYPARSRRQRLLWPMRAAFADSFVYDPGRWPAWLEA